VAGQTQFQLISTPGPNGLLVRAFGRLSLGHGASDGVWEPHIRRGCRISLDLTEVTELDARGLGVLVALARQAQQDGIAISVAGASPAVSSLAAVVHLDQVLGGNWGVGRARPAA
jgi:ABC-type transporter Mla MlaB component